MPETVEKFTEARVTPRGGTKATLKPATASAQPMTRASTVRGIRSSHTMMLARERCPPVRPAHTSASVSGFDPIAKLTRTNAARAAAMASNA